VNNSEPGTDVSGSAVTNWISEQIPFAIYQQSVPRSAFVGEHREQATSGLTVASAKEQASKSRSEVTRTSSGLMNSGQRWDIEFFNTLSLGMTWFVGTWVLGVLLLSLRLLVGWRIVNRLRILSVIPVSRIWQEKLMTLARGMRISRSVQLLESTLLEVPTVIGWLSPVVLFPAGMLTRLTPLQLEAVLAHELAHIRRHDYLMNLVQSAIEILLFYHPAVWWLSHRIRCEREHCCDDEAIRVCNDRLTYVLALAAMEEFRASPGLMIAVSGGSLVSRVRRIVSAGTEHRELRSRDRWSVALLTLSCLSAVLLLSVKSSHSALDNKDRVVPVANTSRDDRDKIVRVLEVRGKVELPDGSPANAADVLAVRVKPSVSLEARSETKSDPKGEFVLRLQGVAGRTAEWRLLAANGLNGGRLEDSIRIEPAPGAQDESLIRIIDSKTIRLTPGRTISGRVLRKTTVQPIANARVYSGRGQIVMTDDQGRFELRGIPKGVESLCVESPGMVATRAFIDLTERAAATVDIFVSVAGKLNGQVLLADGRPLPNATVEQSANNIFFRPVFTRTTDSNGRFSFDVFPTNRLLFPLSIKTPGFQETASKMFAIRDRNQPTEIILPAEEIPNPEPGGGPSGLMNVLAGSPTASFGFVRGRVIDGDGNPVRNFVVSLLPATPSGANDMGGHSHDNRHFTEDDGRFEFGGLDEDKRYRIAVTALDDSQTVVEPVYARTREQIANSHEVEFQLRPPIQLRIRVLDNDAKKPLPDVMVGQTEIRTNRIALTEFEWDLNLHRARRMEWTSREGVAEFSQTANEDSLIFIEHKGYSRRFMLVGGQADTLIADQSGQIELLLEKEARIRILIPVAVRPGAEFHADLESDRSAGRLRVKSLFEKDF
jgi:beta-lactamase regulating signal transducer with metallopeptidase domain/protocatechuate 3,4-dioxygenase beta subunit